VKASSLPRDVASFPLQVRASSTPAHQPRHLVLSQFYLQSPERAFFARRIDEDRAEEVTSGPDFSLKDDGVLAFGAGLETSTPVKSKGLSDAGRSLDFKDE
jgi:hypothetical protein